MGKFELKEAKTGYVFNLLATNGQVIASSQVYKSKSSAVAGINSVKKNAAAPVEDQTVEAVAAQKCPKFEVYTDKAGEFRFRLKATNGQVIAVGQGYKSKASCLNGIKSIGKNAPEAEIVAE